MSSSTAAPSARTTLLDDLDFELEGAGGWTGGTSGGLRDSVETFIAGCREVPQLVQKAASSSFGVPHRPQNI